MAVAALSTSAIALATAPAAAPTPATGEAPQSFARLVSRAQPDGQGSQGDAMPQTAEGETDTADATAEKTVATPEDEGGAAPAQKVDLLAELEAIFAAAAQLGVPAPMAVSTPTAPVASAIAVTPDAIAAATGSNAKIIADLSIAADRQTAAQPAPANLFATKAAEAAEVTIPVDPAVTIEKPATQPAGEPASDGATTALRRDIATIVASLKAAFHPTETGSSPAVASAPPPAASAVVTPLGQVPLATNATPLSMVTVPEAPVAAVAPATTDGEASVDRAIVATPSPEAATHKTATLVAPKAAPPVSLDTVLQAVATNVAEKAAPTATPADASVSSSAEAPAVSAATAIAPAPLTATQVMPAAAPSTSWAETPMADAAAAAAPNPAEQSMTRHLDLARDTQWLDQLARDISQSATQQGHLKFQLNPEHLGALTVEIANSAAGTAIKLTAETDQARAIIADAQPRLLAEVRAQGLRVAESHVDLNQQGSGGSAFAQGQQRQSSENSKPFVPTQTVNREDAGDSAPRDDGELYA